jgi:hypothetical protein
MVTWRKLAREGASTGDGRLTGRVRSPLAKLVTSLSGGSGHRPGQHYDWPARCSLHWRRGGSSRLHPVIPGSAAPGLSRGVTALASAAVERREASALPRLRTVRLQDIAPSGAPPPFAFVEAKRSWLWHSSDAQPHRENNAAHPPPRKRGRGTIRSCVAAQDGGGGASVSAALALQNELRFRRPSHRANARSPLPAVAGRDERKTQSHAQTRSSEPDAAPRLTGARTSG